MHVFIKEEEKSRRSETELLGFAIGIVANTHSSPRKRGPKKRERRFFMQIRGGGFWGKRHSPDHAERGGGGRAKKCLVKEEGDPRKSYITYSMLAGCWLRQGKGGIRNERRWARDVIGLMRPVKGCTSLERGKCLLNVEQKDKRGKMSAIRSWQITVASSRSEKRADA